MGSGSVGKSFYLLETFWAIYQGWEGGKSPIVLSASRRVVALLGNVVVLGREWALERWNKTKRYLRKRYLRIYIERECTDREMEKTEKKKH